MHRGSFKGLRAALTGGLAVAACALVAAGATAAPRVATYPGAATPGTPDELNKVRVVKQGNPKAEKILVLVPGTSAGATNFRPMADGLLKKLRGEWQVWSIERRENLLEDHSMLQRYNDGLASSEDLIGYYFGMFLGREPRFQPKTTEETAYARDWGLAVAVRDIRKVVREAGRRDRTVVLGGHSLGGSITTAYATWDFNGKAGAEDLDGLVFIDGAGGGRAPEDLPTPEQAQAGLDELQTQSPFLDLLGLGLPWAAGVFNAMGSTAATVNPDEPSAMQRTTLLPAMLRPPVATTNLAQYGYAVDVDTSPPSLRLVQNHIGHLAESGDPRGWVDGELGSARRAASVFKEWNGMDGTSWYHPIRLSLDAGTVNNGNAIPAQDVLGVRAIHGDDVRLPMYAFDAALGAGRVSEATRELARQSGVPKRWVTTVDRSSTYAHIDPLSADPRKNAFIKTLAPFLKKKVK